MIEEVKKIVIVGGGTAGWYTAAYLSKAFNRNGTEPSKLITVIESPDIPIIGVGESTLPSIVHALSNLDINERDMMRATNATFKNAIKFVQWKDSPEVNPKDWFYHPFGGAGVISDDPALSYWMAWNPPGRKPPFGYATGPGPYLSDRLLAPKSADSKSFKGTSTYAYHMDAVLLGRYLRSVCAQRGVQRIEDTVLHATLSEEGNIAAVVTKNAGAVEGDLFIDCTGFARLLIGQLLQSGFVSYAETLLCDTALAVQVPFDENERSRINCFTTATAQSGGWIWNIHLQGRRGIGYVYSSAHVSEAAAERTLLDYLGPRAEMPQPRKLPMKVGRSAEFWRRNCVAIGLSGGFTEPLEATGIWTIQAGVHHLRQNFPDRSFPEPLRKKYNEIMATNYDEIRDFIALHYCLTSREDSAFWRDNKHGLRLSDSLQENLQLWRHRPPMAGDLKAAVKPFDYPGYGHILVGMGHPPQGSNAPLSTAAAGNKVERAFNNIQRDISTVLATSISHADYLRGLAA